MAKRVVNNWASPGTGVRSSTRALAHFWETLSSCASRNRIQQHLPDCVRIEVVVSLATLNPSLQLSDDVFFAASIEMLRVLVGAHLRYIFVV